MQEDIERLCKWSKDWLLGFTSKSGGNVQFEYEYGMTDTQNNLHVLSTEDTESDLGILCKKNLKFDEHIDNTVNKVDRIMGLIKKNLLI